MTRFELSQLAAEDLKAIAKYTQTRWGKHQRLSYLLELDKTFHVLVKTPQVGTTCNEIREGYRKMACGNHVIYYLEHDVETLLIVRVLHMAMDINLHIPKSHLA